jgi:hypothetical protein
LLATIKRKGKDITAYQITDERKRNRPLSMGRKDDKLNIDGDLVVSGRSNYGLHVNAGGIVNDGPLAVYVFGDRDQKSDSWSWHAQDGIARLSNGQNADRFTIDGKGNTSISGKLTVGGASIDKGSLEIKIGEGQKFLFEAVSDKGWAKTLTISYKNNEISDNIPLLKLEILYLDQPRLTMHTYCDLQVHGSIYAKDGVKDWSIRPKDYT